MHSVQLIKASVVALTAAFLVAEVSAGTSAPHGRAPTRHRRHHAKKSNHRRGSPSSCDGSSSTDSASSSGSSSYGHGHNSGSSSSNTTTPTNSTSNGDDSSNDSGNDSGDSSSSTGSSSSSTGLGFTSNLLAMNNVFVGFLPDGGDAGGSRQSMSEINSAIGAKSAAYGWYAQAHSGSAFTGGQLTQVMADVKACNCVFQPAVMPTGGWQGLTQGDNSQAVNIAKVMKQFTDQGIPVWLRFAHEMNFYQTDGTYQGNAADFKEGWAVVAAAVRKIAPDVKMWWTPNIASADSYAQYAPDDMSTVDLVGIDYYPKSLAAGDFKAKMQGFHDKYAVNGRQFAIGETGLGYGGPVADRLSWLKQVVDAKSSMPQLIAASWFNYQKGYSFQIVGNSNMDSQFKSLIKS